MKEDSSVFQWSDKDDIVDIQFRKMKSLFTDKGIPVVLGEYGAILRIKLARDNYEKHIESRNRYLS